MGKQWTKTGIGEAGEAAADALAPAIQKWLTRFMNHTIEIEDMAYIAAEVVRAQAKKQPRLPDWLTINDPGITATHIGRGKWRLTYLGLDFGVAYRSHKRKDDDEVLVTLYSTRGGKCFDRIPIIQVAKTIKALKSY